MAHAGKYSRLATADDESIELDIMVSPSSSADHGPRSPTTHHHHRLRSWPALLSALTLKNLLYFLSLWCVVLVFLFYYNFGESSLSLNHIKGYFFSDSSVPGANRATFPFGCDPIKSDSAAPYSVTIDGFSYPQSTIITRNQSIDFECLNQSPNVKRILLWTAFFNDLAFGFGQLGAFEPFKKNKCPVVNCELTSDKNLLGTSDLVLAHMRDALSPIPGERPADQRWVFVLYESPVHASDFSEYNRKFNLTSTYRRDGDFPGFYESDAMMRWAYNAAFNVSKNFLAPKKHFAAIVVSNCGASNRRLDYVAELQKYVQVDIFGKCGKPCPTHLESSNEPADCKYIIGSEYKFYFAFENSNCVDYITEKFFTILQFDVIPVVLGGGAYEHYVPPSGYINVLDYESPRKLADYLIHLSETPAAYNAYFKWKQHVLFDQVPIHFSSICSMCIQLHLEEVFGIKRKVIDDIGKYWSTSESCIKPKLGL